MPDLYVRTMCSAMADVECDIGGGIGGGTNAASITPTVTAGSPAFAFVDGAPAAGTDLTYVLAYAP